MNRAEFCQLLVETREKTGLSKNAMCRLTGFTFGQLQFLEAKPNNFSMDKAFYYLDCICKVVIVQKGRSKKMLCDMNSVASWLQNARKGVYSQRTLATAIDCAYPTIANIERGSSKVTVDIFLKLVDVLGYTIKIEPK